MAVQDSVHHPSWPYTHRTCSPSWLLRDDMDATPNFLDPFKPIGLDLVSVLNPQSRKKAGSPLNERSAATLKRSPVILVRGWYCRLATLVAQSNLRQDEGSNYWVDVMGSPSPDTQSTYPAGCKPFTCSFTSIGKSMVAYKALRILLV